MVRELNLNKVVFFLMNELHVYSIPHINHFCLPLFLRKAEHVHSFTSSNIH